MPTTCTKLNTDTIVQGDAVCMTDYDSGNSRPTVRRATATNLAGSKTVFGVAKTPTNSTTVDVFVAGEAAPNSITSLGAGDSRIIATDINQVAAADQCRLIRIDRPEGSEHVVGTCDEGGNLAVQPRASTDTSAQYVFNVRSYGAVPGVVRTTGTILVASSTTYTADDAPFTAADVGKTILVTGAGTATGGAPLITTIAAYVATNEVTLTAPSASASDVNSAVTVFGFDAAPAARAALAAMGDVDTTKLPGNRSKLFFPAGEYLFATPVRVDRRVLIEGAVSGGTTIACAEWSSGFIFEAQVSSGTSGDASSSIISHIAFVGGPQPGAGARWTPNTAYSVGDRILPGNVGAPKTVAPPNGVVTYTDSPYSWEYHYVCVVAGTSEAIDAGGAAVPTPTELEAAKPWTRNTAMSVGDIIKLPPPATLPVPDPCWQDTVFFRCTTAGTTGNISDEPPMDLFAAATTPGDVVTGDGINGLVWTAFVTNEPRWNVYQGIEESVVWQAGLAVSYGTVVRVPSRPDVHFLCITPSGAPVTSGTNVFALADIVFGETVTEVSVDPSMTTITWQAWPTGAEQVPSAWAAGNYSRGDKVLGSNGIRYICQTPGNNPSGIADPFVGETFDPSTHGWYDPMTGALITVSDGPTPLEWIPYEPFINMLIDNNVVWAVAASNAVRSLCPYLSVASCDARGFPNAAFHFQGNLNTKLDGFGGVPSSNVNGFVVRTCSATQCGVGVLTRGGDANAGSGYDVVVTGASNNEGTVYPAERGIVDRGFLGNRWYTPLLQSVGGPAFSGPVGSGSAGAVFGLYMEGDCGACDVFSTSYSLVGGVYGSAIQVFGQPTRRGGLTGRTEVLGVLPAPAYASNLAALGTTDAANQSALFALAQFTMEAAGDGGYYDWRFDGATGWWNHTYSAAAVAWKISSASATWLGGRQVGYGLFALPRGVLIGDPAPEYGYYSFPTTLLSKSPRIKSGGRDVGDRRGTSNLASPGGYLEQVVTRSGFEPENIWKAGATYSAGNASGPQRFTGNTVAPSDPSLAYVLVCTTSGEASPTTEPDWAAHLDGIAFDDHAGGTLQWTYLGTRAEWSPCTRVQDRTLATQTEPETAWTGVPVVRTLKAAATFNDTATHDILTYALPAGAVTQLDCIVGAVQSDIGAAATFEIRGAWSVAPGGAPTVVDAVVSTPGSANSANLSATFVVSGGSVVVRVQKSVAATQITWNAALRGQESYALVAPDPGDAELVGWYRADSLAGERVSSWVDGSASGNDADQADPTLRPAYYASDPNFNARASVVFDGTTTVLGSVGTIDLTGGYTIFVVSRVGVPQNFNGIFRYASDSSASDTESVSLYATSDGDVVWALSDSGTWNWQSSNRPMGLGRVCSTCITSDGVAFAIRINGVDVTADGTTAGVLGLPAAARNIFPGAGYYASAMLNGESAEIIVYDTMRTDAEIQQTEAYLRTRYAHY